MTKKTDGHEHTHGHAHKKEHVDNGSRSTEGTMHKDWRFWAVCAMIVAMAIYVLSEDESIVPGGAPGEPVPAMDDAAE
jgi:hypothetical protein